MSLKRIYLLIISILFFNLKTEAQLILNTTQTPQQLVNDVLLGAGVTAFNITFNGAPIAIGKFVSIGTNIGLDSGIVMTTGTVLDQGASLGPSGPANQLMSFDNGAPGDAALTAIAGNNTFNASVLEFDFIPVSDTVQFRYVFASEEYPNFCCGNFNDVFAFILTGVSTPFPATNIALLPLTPPIPVTINNVHNGAANNGPCTNCQFYNNNTANGMNAQNGQFVRFNGFTNVLTAMSPVICGETYHIKMAIADVFDRIYDSGVFLEAGSFSGGSVQIATTINSGGYDSLLYEGCGNMTVLLNRAGNITTSDTVFLSTSGQAIEGVNYDSLPPFLIFAPGVTQVSFTIQANHDTISQGIQNAQIQFTSNNSCLSSSVSTYDFVISDLPPVDVRLSNDTTVCFGETLNIQAIASGGVLNSNQYFYDWNNGTSVGQNLSFTVLSDTTIYVTATDVCGLIFDTDSMSIVASQSITAGISNDTIICIGDQITLTANGGTSYIWTPGNALNVNNAANVQTNINNTTTFTVIVGAGSCIDTASVTVEIRQLPNVQVTPNAPIICKTNSVNLNLSGAVTYQWTPHNTLQVINNTSAVANTMTTRQYNVRGFDDIGCRKDTSVIVTVRPELDITLFNPSIEVCSLSRTEPIIPIVTGGDGNYTFEWFPNADLSSTSDSVITASPSNTMYLKLRVTDGCNSPAVLDSILITVLNLPATNYSINTDTACMPATIFFDHSNALTGSSCIWDFGNGIFSGDCNTNYYYPDAGLYNTRLSVIDSNGCEDSTNIIPITVLQRPVANFYFTPENTDALNPNISFIDQSSSDVVNWYWNFANLDTSTQTNPYFSFPDSGYYLVELVVENDLNCLDTTYDSVRIKPAMILYIPTAFTPTNEDGLNDVFKAYGYGFEQFNIKIFSRWGIKVFESNDINIGWDGTYKGNLVPKGNYIYQVEALGPDFLEFRKIGNIVIIRGND
jgi:gliding motility-associated-like protein